MADLVFVQMSGQPGSGKTTVATAFARRIGAVIIDHDVTKTALLNAGVAIELAGKASYDVLGAVARHLLQQGHSVVHDSPCAYENLLKRGQELAAEARAAYRYIECVVDDLEVLDRRLRTRPRLRSQRRGLGIPGPDVLEKARSLEEILRTGLTPMKRPADGYLLLDATRPLEALVEEAIVYIKTGIPTGRI